MFAVDICSAYVGICIYQLYFGLPLHFNYGYVIEGIAESLIN